MRPDGLAEGQGLRLLIAAAAHHISTMPQFGLTDDERDALIALLRDTIAVDRFPLSPRVRLLKTILAKLEPQQVLPEPYPALKGPGERSMVLTRKRRR